MQARIRIECPRCGKELSCYGRDITINSARWALTHESADHLTSASCTKPEPVLINVNKIVEVAA